MGLFEKFPFILSAERKKQCRTNFLIGLMLVSVSGTIGILIGVFAINGRPPSGYFTNNTSMADSSALTVRVVDQDEKDGISMMNSISAEFIESYVRENSVEPNIAGTPIAHRRAKKLFSFWKSLSLDNVKISSYKVLLSYPDRTKPNGVTLTEENGTVLLESYSKFQDNDTYPPFMAYSASGVVGGEYVYVNYGQADDYFWLQYAGIALHGKIHIARHGRVFRGDKVKNAEDYGAIGVILYPDPSDFAQSGYSDTSWHLPLDGAQRGHIYSRMGDPLTPDYPATENSYRISQSDAYPPLPKIPVYPISAGVAVRLLGELDGPEAPTKWRGNLNITYRICSGPSSKNRSSYAMARARKTFRKMISYSGIISVEAAGYVYCGYATTYFVSYYGK